MSEPKLCLIVARARNGVIGADGGIPWRLKDDMAHFKATTLDCPVIMGRKTWESLPVRPLARRPNLVISRDWTYQARGARVYSSIQVAVSVGRAIALRSGRPYYFVIGGEAIYQATLDLADRVYLTEVDADIPGDARFPDLDASKWKERARTDYASDERNDHAFTIRVLDRA